MTQVLIPEIQAAVDALENQIVLTEAEVADLKKTVKEKRQLVKGWRKAIAAVNPKPEGQKRNAATR